MAQSDRDGTILMLNPAFTCLVMPLVGPDIPAFNIVELLDSWLPELRSLLQDPRPRGMICDDTPIHLGPAAPGHDPSVLALTVVRMDADRHMALLADVTKSVAFKRRVHDT